MIVNNSKYVALICYAALGGGVVNMLHHYAFYFSWEKFEKLAILHLNWIIY